MLLLVDPSNFCFETLKSVTISVDYAGCCSHGEKMGELARYQLLRWIYWMDGQLLVRGGKKNRTKEDRSATSWWPWRQEMQFGALDEEKDVGGSK